MASHRVIDSAIWDDDWFGQLGFFEQALWIGLFSKCADDQGRLLDNVVLIRAAVFPYKDVGVEEIEATLAAFAAASRLYRYRAGGKRLIQVLRWWRHQPQQWAQASRYPAPPGWADHVRTRQSGRYLESNWLGIDGNAKASDNWHPETASTGDGRFPPSIASSPEGFTCTSQAGRQDPDPVPDPDPVNSDANASGPGGPRGFAQWRDSVKDATAKERPVVLRDFIVEQFPNNVTPTISDIAGACRDVGGAGRLLDLLWQLVPRPPTGDLMAYCRQMARGRDSPRGNGKSPGTYHHPIAKVPDGFNTMSDQELAQWRRDNGIPDD